MIYSRWRPDQGGYDYFESSERIGLGDDLPAPSLPFSGPIGVASTSIGRVPKGPTRRVGAGPAPRGSIMPLSRAGLSGIDVSFSLGGALGLAAACAVGFWLGRRRRAS